MRIKTTLSISEARKNIFTIIQEVQKIGNHYTFTEKGRPKAVMMSAEEYESWQETIETLREIPDLKKDIEETEQAHRSGEYKNWMTLENLLTKEGFLVADAPKKYELSDKNQVSRGKRVKKTK